VSRCYEVIGMAKDSDSIRELREKLARHYGKRQGQFTLFLNPPQGLTCRACVFRTPDL